MEAILEAAAHILVAQGYETATTREVAQRAGVSIGSLYQYFPSKEALLLALIEQQVQRVLEVCAQALQVRGQLVVHQVVSSLTQGLLKAYAVNPRLHQVLVTEGMRLGLMQAFHELDRRLETTVTSFLLHHREALRPQRVELTAFLLMRGLRGIIWAAAIERPELFDDPALAQELDALVLGYLLP